MDPFTLKERRSALARVDSYPGMCSEGKQNGQQKCGCGQGFSSDVNCLHVEAFTKDVPKR